MPASVVINDILPYTQTVAMGGQTLFSTDWTANYESDVVVYITPVGDAPNDATQRIPYPSGYSVAFIGSENIVEVTLVNPTLLGEIVTITRDTPADRLNLYTNTNFTPSMLNQDVGILTLVDQQAQLVNQRIGPRYNYSAQINVPIDTILPILGPNQLWAKDQNDTAIIALDVPSSGIGPAGATFLTATDQTSILPNSSVLQAGTNVTLTPGANSLTISVTGATIISGNQYDLAYYAANGNVLSPLATSPDGLLVTDSSGQPSISQTLPASLNPLPIVNGGTGVIAVPTNPTASAFVGWDANINIPANNFLPNYATTATAAGTTTLTDASAYYQFFTGSTTQTVTLPVASTMRTGQSFYVVNQSSGNVTVQSSGGNSVQVMVSGTSALITCILNSGTSAASWFSDYAFNGGSGSGTVNSGTINQLAYYAATGVAVSGLATANDGVLVTSGTGVPSISSTLPSSLTIPAPLIGTGLYDSNGSLALGIPPIVGTPVNYIYMQNSATGFPPYFGAAGTDTNVTLALVGQGTGGVAIQGTGTNNNAPTGYLGEYVIVNVPVASAVSVSSGIPANVAAMNLTPGDWDVFGVVNINPPAVVSVIAVWCSSTSATTPDFSLTTRSYSGSVGGNAYGQTAPYYRVSTAANPLTIYLEVLASFASGSCVAYGTIYARRRR